MTGRHDPCATSVQLGARCGTAKGMRSHGVHDARHVRFTAGPFFGTPEVAVRGRANGGHHLVHQFTQARVATSIALWERWRRLRGGWEVAHGQNVGRAGPAHKGAAVVTRVAA